MAPVLGGPMYYLTRGSSRPRECGPLGQGLAVSVLYSLCLGGSLGGANMFQSNQAYAAFSRFGTWLTGLGLWPGLWPGWQPSSSLAGFAALARWPKS
jgi:AGCS family alanine or glycine:cation symporter